MRNLHSNNPVEFQALEKFVKDIYDTILRNGLERWYSERKDEASLEMTLDDLIKRGLRKIA